MTLAEATDRLAIRELIDAYAHCADRRDAKGQMALFTEDTEFRVFMDSRSPEPSYAIHGREALAPAGGWEPLRDAVPKKALATATDTRQRRIVYLLAVERLSGRTSGTAGQFSTSTHARVSETRRPAYRAGWEGQRKSPDAPSARADSLGIRFPRSRRHSTARVGLVNEKAPPAAGLCRMIIFLRC